MGRRCPIGTAATEIMSEDPVLEIQGYAPSWPIPGPSSTKPVHRLQHRLFFFYPHRPRRGPDL